MSRIATGTLKYVHDRDPREVIYENLGDISGYQVHGPRVLVAVYDPGNKQGDTKIKHGTLELIAAPVSGGTTDEYRFQGRVCLVLKKGPFAFKDDDNNKWHGDTVEEGDWVVLRPTDGNSLNIGKQTCRLVEDGKIQLTVPDPDAVY